MTIESLQKLLAERMTQLQSAQRQLADTLPRMTENACCYRVSDLLEEQAQRLQDQLQQLEQLFALAGEKPTRARCTITRDALREISALMEDEIDLEVVDAGLLDSLQRIQTNLAELAQGASETAQLLGIKEACKTLQEIAHQAEAVAERCDFVAVRFMRAPALAV